MKEAGDGSYKDESSGEIFYLSREFNDFRIDKKRNRIIKKSCDVDKLKQELRWFQEVPEEFSSCIPKIYGRSFQGKSAELEMEFIDMKSLGSHIVDGHEGFWDDAFSDILGLLSDFHQSCYKTGADRQSLEEMYVAKTERRLQNLKDTKQFSRYFDKKTLNINGVEMKSAGYILENIEDILHRNSVLEMEKFTLIHGDFHLSNIFYDSGTGGITLIDPRGKFGDYTVRGDPRYDLAKLAHSFMGKYDFIVRDKFELEKRSDSLEFDIQTNAVAEKTESIFENKLESEFDFDLNEIKAIEGLLFLSMIPLHSGNPDRQHVIISKGIEIFNEGLI